MVPLRLTIASLLLATSSAEVCLTDTGGTCRFLNCYSSRGPADCDSDYKCICKPGYCAYGGTCQKPEGCSEYTPGTCNVLPCKSKRGETECAGGKCVCKPGACATDGVCYSSCPKDTGGSCKVMGCSASRKAVCSWPNCVCPEGTCALNGKCLEGREYAMALAAVGNRTDALSAYAPMETFGDYVNHATDFLEEPLILGGAVALCSTMFIGISMLRRRRGASIGEPLLTPAPACEQTAA